MTNSAQIDYLMIFAHPDDETFGLGGMLMWARDTGVNIGVVCATRGESGEISDPSLGTLGSLGAARERELRRAMAAAGVEHLRLLPYRDSGMDGTPQNDDPRSLAQATDEAVIADVVFQIRDLKPRSVITFGPDGIYGHPDHIRIGAMTDIAVQIAASDEFAFLGDPWQVERLYHSAVAREDLIESAKSPHGPIAGLPLEQVMHMGTPRAEITHVFDIEQYVEAKLEIMRFHATQLPFLPEPGSTQDPATRPRIRKESLKRIPLPWNTADETADALDRWHSPEMASLSLTGEETHA